MRLTFWVCFTIVALITVLPIMFIITNTRRLLGYIGDKLSIFIRYLDGRLEYEMHHKRITNISRRYIKRKEQQ